MDVEEKNFSGRKWTDSGRDSGERKSSRVLQNATKGRGRRERRETGRVRKWAGIVTAAGLRGPGGQDAKQKGRKGTGGGHVAFLPFGEKRYLAVCDLNNESEPSRSPTQNRMFYRVNV